MIRVLYCGDPPPEVAAKYLRSSLSKRYTVDYLNPEKNRFPQEESTLTDYQVIILSDVGREQIGETPLRILKGYVSKGGGLLMIGGFASFAGHDVRGNYHNSDVEDILPVTCSSTPDDIAIYRGFHPKPENKTHAIMKNIPWNDFPVLIGYNKVALKEDSILLLKYGTDPILAVREFGRGRTAAFTSDCAPHWCGGLVDWPLYDEFWSKIVSWLAKGI